MRDPEAISTPIFKQGDRVRLTNPIPTLTDSYEGALKNRREFLQQESAELMRFHPWNYRGVRGITGVVIEDAYPGTDSDYLKIRLDRPVYEFGSSNGVKMYTEIMESAMMMIPFLPSDSKADWRKTMVNS